MGELDFRGQVLSKYSRVRNYWAQKETLATVPRDTSILKNTLKKSSSTVVAKTFPTMQPTPVTPYKSPVLLRPWNCNKARGFMHAVGLYLTQSAWRGRALVLQYSNNLQKAFLRDITLFVPDISLSLNKIPRRRISPNNIGFCVLGTLVLVTV